MLPPVLAAGIAYSFPSATAATKFGGSLAHADPPRLPRWRCGAPYRVRLQLSEQGRPVGARGPSLTAAAPFPTN